MVSSDEEEELNFKLNLLVISVLLKDIDENKRYEFLMVCRFF